MVKHTKHASDTMETSLVHCLEHYYSCCALITIRGNELVIFHCIALYSDDKYGLCPAFSLY